MKLPGRRLVLFIIRGLRLLTALYILSLSIANLVLSACDGYIGSIIASVYIIPSALVLLILELGFLARYIRAHVSLLRYEMHPVRLVALQALGAMLSTGPLLIPGLVAFGLGVGLMNLVGLYHLFWRTRGEDGESGSEAWSSGLEEDEEKALGGRLLLPPSPREQDALLLSVGSVDDLGNRVGSEEGSARSGPTVLSVD